jgi:transposase
LASGAYHQLQGSTRPRSAGRGRLASRLVSDSVGIHFVNVVKREQPRSPQGGRVRRLTTILSIAPKIGCTGQTLNDWVNKAEVDAGKRPGASTDMTARRPGASTDMTARLKALERENRELRQANEILRKASAYFAVAELDRRSKT